jgi:hypothetical protein
VPATQQKARQARAGGLLALANKLLVDLHLTHAALEERALADVLHVRDVDSGRDALNGVVLESVHDRTHSRAVDAGLGQRLVDVRARGAEVDAVEGVAKRSFQSAAVPGAVRDVSSQQRLNVAALVLHNVGVE